MWRLGESESVGSADWRPIQGLHYLSPHDLWDRFQQMDEAKRWMDKWMDESQKAC